MIQLYLSGCTRDAAFHALRNHMVSSVSQGIAIHTGFVQGIMTRLRYYWPTVLTSEEADYLRLFAAQKMSGLAAGTLGRMLGYGFDNGEGVES